MAHRTLFGNCLSGIKKAICGSGSGGGGGAHTHTHTAHGRPYTAGRQTSEQKRQTDQTSHSTGCDCFVLSLTAPVSHFNFFAAAVAPLLHQFSVALSLSLPLLCVAFLLSLRAKCTCSPQRAPA